MNAISANDTSWPQLIEQWREAWANWLIEARKPDGADFDNEGCKFWHQQCQAVLSVMKERQISSREDALTLMTFVIEDANQANGADDPAPQVQRWALDKLRGWLEIT